MHEGNDEDVLFAYPIDDGVVGNTEVQPAVLTVSEAIAFWLFLDAPNEGIVLG